MGRERVDRRVHACAVAQEAADNRRVRTVYGTDQLLQKVMLSGGSVPAAVALWRHEHTRQSTSAEMQRRARAWSPSGRRCPSTPTNEYGASHDAAASAAGRSSPSSSTFAMAPQRRHTAGSFKTNVPFVRERLRVERSRLDHRTRNNSARAMVKVPSSSHGRRSDERYIGADRQPANYSYPPL